MWTNIKDSPEAYFPIPFTISYDSKNDKQICKRKHTQIYMKNIFL